MTGRCALDSARRAGHGHEIGRVEHQIVIAAIAMDQITSAGAYEGRIGVSSKLLAEFGDFHRRTSIR